MIDLDKAQAQADSFFRWAEGYGQERQANFAATAKVLVAELRAAREAVKTLRWYGDPQNYFDHCPGREMSDGEGGIDWDEDSGGRARFALDAYDKVTGEVTG